MVYAGACVGAKDEDERTALHLAAREGQATSIALLHEFGADLRARDQEGKTPLILATAWGQNKAMQVLIKCHKEKDKGLNDEDVEGKTALDCAVEKGWADMARTLKLAGAEVGLQRIWNRQDPGGVGQRTYSALLQVSGAVHCARLVTKYGSIFGTLKRLCCT